MKRFALIVAATVVLSLAAIAAQRPNIILILADDLGWSDLGCYGGEIPTANIDALARGGLRFTQFYNNAVCGPSRASLITGLYCQRIGHSGVNWNEPTNFTRSFAIAEALQAAGYRTALVGKWQERELPARRGFDRFFGPMCLGKISYFHEVQLNPFYLDEQRYTLPKDFYLTDALTDFAVEFLNEASDPKRAGAKPFFLHVTYIAPHYPLHARETEIAPHRARYRERGWDEWSRTRLERQRSEGLIPASFRPAPRPKEVHAWADDPHQDWQAERMAVYAAQVAALDRGVGRIMEAVREAGLAENTLVLFLSDNGAVPDGGLAPSPGGFGFAPGKPNNTWRLDGVPIRPGSGPDNPPGPPATFAAYGLAWASLSNTPFRATKLTGYEGGIRTPLIAHWPAVIRERGKIIPDIGHVIDLMPTCLEVAGASYPAEFHGRRLVPPDGKSLAPLFRGEPRQAHDFLAWRVPQHRVLRAGNWKLVGAGANGAWELYDMNIDASETADIAAQHPDLVKRLGEKWQSWADDCASSSRRREAGQDRVK